MRFLQLLPKTGMPEANLAIGYSTVVRAFGGGEATGPRPVDRRRLGTTHTLGVDGTACRSSSTPLQRTPVTTVRYSQLSPASPECSATKAGRAAIRVPSTPDRGYDSETTPTALHAKGIEPVIAHRIENDASSLGRIRSVVERTISWFKGVRRIRVHYDRLARKQPCLNKIAAAKLLSHLNRLAKLARVGLAKA